ncbi:MAG: dienelactone hydrolase family protein [Acidobacteriota bacterium]
MRKLLAGIVLLVIVASSATLIFTSSAQTDGRVAAAPTREDQLPKAIIGNASPLAGEAVSYFPDDPNTRGYLAVPEGPGPHGAVILVHEWNGLVDRVRQVADALAAEGYVALAADVYSGRTGSNPEENMALVQETMGKPEVLIANLDAAASYLRGRSDVSGKIGAMGWCYGGGVALSYALGGEAHDATAIFYGRLLDDPEKLRHLNHEIYGTFAGLDQGPSPEQVGGFVAALREAGIPNDIHIYDGVNHAFWLFVDQDFAKRSGPALDAWQRLKAYLGRTIGN